MTESKLLQDLRNHLNEIARSHDLVIEDLRWLPAKHARLVVTVDLDTEPGSVDSQRLEDVSRQISAELDDFPGLSKAYTLEVTTPGAERELTEHRHYLRSRGRMVSFVLHDGTKFAGRIESVAGETIELSDSEVHSVERADIQSARVVIEFKR